MIITFLKKHASLCFLLFCFIPVFVFGKNQTVLLKLSNADSLKKISPLRKLNAAEQLLNSYQVNNIRYVFPTVAAREDQQLSQWLIGDIHSFDSAENIVVQLSRLPNFEFAQVNRPYILHYIPNDPMIDEQYALDKIDAYKAWDIQTGRKDVIIAIIDTGIDYLHPDLAENIWINKGEDINRNGQVDDSDFNGIDDDFNGFIDDIRGWDFTDAPNYPSGGDYLVADNDPMDEHGHGTGAAGIIAGKANNSLGMAGLAFDCQMMNLRAFNANGYGEEDDVASALLYAINNGAQVVNMSWGDVFVSRIIDDVLQYGANKNIIMVASAGNSSSDQIHYPSGFAETISVGSSDENDVLSSFSNYGSTIDLVAPGSRVLSCTLDENYRTWDGTSFAAPFVSAAAGLLLSSQFGLSSDAVRAKMVNSADDIGVSGWDDRYGAGRLNVYRALTQPTYSITEIYEPRLDAGFNSPPLYIRGSAWSPNFKCYCLFYGSGENPDEWSKLGEDVSTPVFDDLLYIWNDLPENEGEYTLRLVVTDREDNETEKKVRIFIDRTPPVVTDFNIVPMLDGDSHSVLVQVNSDDLCEGSIFYRHINERTFQEAPMSFRTNELRYNLSQKECQGKIQLWAQINNSADLVSLVDNSGSYYLVDLDQPPLDVTRFTPGFFSMPFGRILDKTTDFNMNGFPELIVSEINDGAIGAIKLYENNQNEMIPIFTTDCSLIPRDIGDADNDGKMELLCGFGFKSFLYEAEQKGGFPNRLVAEWEGDGSTQFWASRIADLDADGKGEIVMRVVDAQDSDQFEIWETTGDNQFYSVSKLQNPTQGENFFGVPKTVIGDFDNDGKLEILCGDSDGDIYIYENIGNDAFHATWQDSLPLLDSIDFLAAGDFDGDGRSEFIAGCHSDPNLNTEHYYDARHWLYRVYKSNGNDSYTKYAEWRFFGYESTRDFMSGVSCGDIDNDGIDEIFITVYPDFYMIDFENNTLDVVFYYSGAQNSATLVTDINLDGRNELWMGNGDQIYSFEQVGSNTGPAAPVGFSAQPLDSSTVFLIWRQIEGVDEYYVYRGLAPDSLQLLSTVTQPQFFDQSVIKDVTYYYALQAVDFEKSPHESRLSGILHAKPGEKPFLENAIAETNKTVRLYFSEPMNASVKNASLYKISHSVDHPTSVTVNASGSEVLLTLSTVLNPNAAYEVICYHLLDVDGTPIDTTRNSKIFSIQEQKIIPYIVEGSFLDINKIELVFDQKMDKMSVEDKNNYQINDKLLVDYAKVSEPDNESVHLYLKKGKISFGDTVAVHVQNIKSYSGESIRLGRGDILFFIAPEESQNNIVKQVQVYPNPYTVDCGSATITFAYLCQGETVHIFSSSGQFVRTFQPRESDGNLNWDLKNKSGDLVASGVYIYKVSGGTRQSMGKFAIIR